MLFEMGRDVSTPLRFSIGSLKPDEHVTLNILNMHSAAEPGQKNYELWIYLMIHPIHKSTKH